MVYLNNKASQLKHHSRISSIRMEMIEYVNTLGLLSFIVFDSLRNMWVLKFDPILDYSIGSNIKTPYTCQKPNSISSGIDM